MLAPAARADVATWGIQECSQEVQSTFGAQCTECDFRDAEASRVEELPGRCRRKYAARARHFRCELRAKSAYWDVWCDGPARPRVTLAEYEAEQELGPRRWRRWLLVGVALLALAWLGLRWRRAI